MGSRSWAGKENLTEAISDTPMNLWAKVSNVRIIDRVLMCGGWKTENRLSQSLSLQTHFRSMLKRVLNFELSSVFSDRYASGLEIVVVSAVEAIEVVGDGAGDAWALFERVPPEDGELILEGARGYPCVD